MAKDSTSEAMINDMQARLRPAFVGCSVVIVVILLGLATVLFIWHESPYWQEMNKCRMRMQRVGDALGRYAILNKKYPDQLSELVPEYVPASALHCPKEDSSADQEEFIYSKQSVDARDDAILLICERHRLNSKMPGVVLRYLKKGVVIPVSAKDVPPTSNP